MTTFLIILLVLLLLVLLALRVSYLCGLVKGFSRGYEATKPGGTGNEKKTHDCLNPFKN